MNKTMSQKDFRINGKKKIDGKKYSDHANN